MMIRTTQLTVAPEGEPIFSERAYTVTIDDQAAGEYVVVESLDDQGGKIAIDKADWVALRNAIEQMVAICRD